MEAVLPLKISGDWQDYDLERASMLINSIDYYWRGDLLHLYIIARDEDIGRIEQRIKPSKIQISITSETLLVPELANCTALGWIKQQVIKLNAFRVVESDFFLTLDADLFCTKVFSEANLVFDNKAVNDWELRNAHGEWWRGSSEFLRTPTQPEGYGLAVTPEILSTNICRRLDSALHKLYGNYAWRLLLSREANSWSEYSIYNLFAEEDQCLFDFHNSQSHLKPKIYP